MSRQNISVVLAERPVKDVVPGTTFRVETSPAPTEAVLKDGQLLVEALYLGLDPAMRGWLKDVRSYLPPVQIGEKMRGLAIARVLASKSDKAKTGDIVTALSGWTEVAIVPEAQVENPFAKMPAAMRANLKVTDLLGSMGMTGLTAYFGMAKVAGEITSADTVVISGAAGATGSVAGQIAKLQGAKKVIGIAGSDDKVKWLEEELGFDVGLNYKDPDFAKKFKEATPEFVNVYWDNVGGDILDLALARAAPFARFVMCGGISQYNTDNVQGPKNYLNVVTMRIKMQGFIVFDYIKEYATAMGQLATWLAEGKIKRKETIVKGGLPAAEKALLGLFTGANTGKLLVEVKKPEEDAKL